MKLVVLIDNTPSADAGLSSEHGLSLYFETGGRKYLLDVGLTGKAMCNAERLSVDIREVDALFLSHGHVDHTGGLAEFLRFNQKARIYASRKMVRYSYSSNRRGKEHDLSPDKHLLDEYGDRFVWLTGDMKVSDTIRLVFCQKHDWCCPAGNRYLHLEALAGQLPYTADDELAVRIDEGQGEVILSPCSHNGMLNILEAFVSVHEGNTKVAFVGGLHLLDEESANDHVDDIAGVVRDKYPELRILTGHCTGAAACRKLKEYLGERLTVFRTGDTYVF